MVFFNLSQDIFFLGVWELCEHSFVSNIYKSLIIQCHLHHSPVLIFLLSNKRNLFEGTTVFNVVFACSIYVYIYLFIYQLTIHSLSQKWLKNV